MVFWKLETSVLWLVRLNECILSDFSSLLTAITISILSICWHENFTKCGESKWEEVFIDHHNQIPSLLPSLSAILPSFFFFLNKVSLCSPGWLWTVHFHASISWVLGFSHGLPCLASNFSFGEDPHFTTSLMCNFPFSHRELAWVVYDSRCICFLGLPQQLPKTGWLQTTVIYSLTVLEARVWTCFLQSLLAEDPFLLIPASDNPKYFLVCGGILQYFCRHRCFSLCVCLFAWLSSPLIWTPVTLD
jgi:hypothetical protein